MAEPHAANAYRPIVADDPASEKRSVARIDRQADAEIARASDLDDDVAPEFTDEMMAQARWIVAPRKIPISLRVDPDVLEFFKRDGGGYQSRMNAVLRAYMLGARARE